ncbi:squalene monooxygenase-like [Quillaja saponaria]|uniref:Squalene monooxygenase-like n=1 Tax=Quillaja saponaria TaxID=32244 RepID=A0AAD7VL56_QUISA|nr:squalene monooxygenase-like [Quillaja saponaria]
MTKNNRVWADSPPEAKLDFTNPGVRMGVNFIVASITGKTNLEKLDLEPALKALKDRVVTKNVIPTGSPELRAAAFIDTIDKGNIRTVPNRSSPELRAAAFIDTIDKGNIRTVPNRRGRMTAVLSDIALLRDLRSQTSACATCMMHMPFAKIPVASTINTLAGALYVLGVK